MAKPLTVIDLAWTRDLVFTATGARGRSIVTDGNSQEGLSPMELLAVATVGCMATDLVHILVKSRQPPAAVRATFTGTRAEVEPHRFVAIRLAFEIEGDVTQAAVDRAVQLSRDKYCSVWNSLREDITLDVVTRLLPPAAHA